MGELARYVQGLGVASADNLNAFVQGADNLAQLRSFIGVDGMQVFLRGYVTPNDGGQGAFYWNSAATGPDNGITIIVPNGVAVGAWVRLNLTAGQGGITAFDTIAAAEAAVIAHGTTNIILLGYYVVGDGGDAQYVAAPGGAGPGKFQSADGAWWIYVPESRGVNVVAFGAKGDNVTNDTASINNACTFATGINEILVFPARSYKYDGPLTLTDAIAGVDALGASLYSSGVAADAILFTGDGSGDNFFGQFNLPNCFNYVSGAAAHLKGVAGVSAFIDRVDGCQDGVLFETTASVINTINNTVNFTWIFDCTQAAIHFKMGTDGIANHQSLQGNLMTGNFVNGNKRSCYVDCPANQISGCNDIDLNVGADDGDAVTGNYGFHCPVGIMNGPFTYRAATFMGGHPAGDIVIPDGCNGATFICGWATSPPYDAINCAGVNTKIITTYPQNGSYFSTTLPYAETSSNSRSSFNGGGPLGANRLNVACDISAGMTAGDTKQFFAYSPFLTGFDEVLHSWDSPYPIIVQAVTDNSVAADLFMNGPHPNQISISVLAVATFGSFSPNTGGCRVKMRIAGG